MTRPNAELLRTVREEIEYTSSWEWDFTSIARRWEDRDAGWLFAYSVEGFVINEACPKALWHWHPDPDRDGHWFAVLVSVDGSRRAPGRNAAFVARKLLGLDRGQAELLFDAKGLGEVCRILDELCDAAPS